jgi:hypothetical protein
MSLAKLRSLVTQAARSARGVATAHAAPERNPDSIPLAYTTGVSRHESPEERAARKRARRAESKWYEARFEKQEIRRADRLEPRVRALDAEHKRLAAERRAADREAGRSVREHYSRAFLSALGDNAAAVASLQAARSPEEQWRALAGWYRTQVRAELPAVILRADLIGATSDDPHRLEYGAAAERRKTGLMLAGVKPGGKTSAWDVQHQLEHRARLMDRWAAAKIRGGAGWAGTDRNDEWAQTVLAAMARRVAQVQHTTAGYLANGEPAFQPMPDQLRLRVGPLLQHGVDLGEREVREWAAKSGLMGPGDLDLFERWEITPLKTLDRLVQKEEEAVRKREKREDERLYRAQQRQTGRRPPQGAPGRA